MTGHTATDRGQVFHSVPRQLAVLDESERGCGLATHESSFQVIKDQEVNGSHRNHLKDYCYNLGIERNF